MFEDLTSLVLDIGTCKSKIGYGGDDAPRLIPHSYICENKSMDIEGLEKFVVGDKYLHLDRGEKDIHSIFREKSSERCEIDFDKYEIFVQKMLSDELRVDLKSYSLLLSEDVSFQPHETKNNRAKIAQFLFQRLGVANIYFLKNPVLSCFATGRSTALVCDSGETFTKVVPVHDGYCLYKSARNIPYAGASLTESIKAVIKQKLGREIPLSSSSSHITESYRDFHEKLIIEDIKQSFSNRSNEEGVEEQREIQYELPDRNSITLKKEQFEQSLLSPPESQLIKGYNYRGIAQAITDNINSCDIDIKKELYANLLITGGNSLFSNTQQQIVSKVGELAPPNAKVKSVTMVAQQEKVYSGWIGGSIVTSLSSFQSYWVGGQEWKDSGASIIEKKCT